MYVFYTLETDIFKNIYFLFMIRNCWKHINAKWVKAGSEETRGDLYIYVQNQHHGALNIRLWFFFVASLGGKGVIWMCVIFCVRVVQFIWAGTEQWSGYLFFCKTNCTERSSAEMKTGWPVRGVNGERHRGLWASYRFWKETTASCVFGAWNQDVDVHKGLT